MRLSAFRSLEPSHIIGVTGQPNAANDMEERA